MKKRRPAPFKIGARKERAYRRALVEVVFDSDCSSSGGIVCKDWRLVLKIRKLESRRECDDAAC